MNEIETIIKQYLKQAPEGIAEFLADETWKKNIQNVAQKAGLVEDEEAILEDITTLFILGLTTTREYPSDLAKELGISREESEQLTRAVRRDVLAPILPILEAVSESTEHALDIPVENSDIPETITEEENLYSTETTQPAQLHHELIIPEHLEPMVVPQPAAVPPPVKRVVPVNLPTGDYTARATPAPETVPTKTTPTAPSFIRTKSQLPQPKAMVEPIPAPQAPVARPAFVAQPVQPTPLTIPTAPKQPVQPQHVQDVAAMPAQPTEPDLNRHEILGDIENPMPTVKSTGPTLKNPIPLYDQKLSGTVRSPRQEQKIVTPPHKVDPYREEF